ncbi:MAG: sigma-70 family RNA polymerase sigma factor, partial [Anaerolineales bacterium]|nr:sigma-70 family RNA polymerase sigma factor [Anaerolineales bacterium]
METAAGPAGALTALVERAYRREAGQVLATLIGWLGDFDLAEEALQDAFLSAVEHWAKDGVPDRPGAWLTTTARRKAIDRIRRGRAAPVAPEALESLPPAALTVNADLDAVGEIPDERLKLIFTCCHPALPPEAQVALTLHALGGLTTAEIAAAFLVPVPTMAQRLVRAKRKIKAAGIPYQVPPAHLLAERLATVLSVIYLIFTEGYAATSGEALIRHDLCEEALRLARVLEHLVQREQTDVPAGGYAEVLGLLALMLLHHSRRRARVGPAGQLVLLAEQDRGLWDRREIQEGLALLDKALHLRQAGPYQIQAAVSALHAQAARPEATDWPQIAALYRELRRFADTPVVRLNEAVAISLARSPQAGLEQLEALAAEPELAAYAPYHLARADMLRRAGRPGEARAAYQAALAVCENEAERASILAQAAALPP